MRKWCLVLFFIFPACVGFTASILIPMDGRQQNHLKAYGIAFFALQRSVPIDWLLNYRGGSFLITQDPDVENECAIRGVTFEILTDQAAESLIQAISSPGVNMNPVRLEVAPGIAVYTPKNELIPDDTDAVMRVLDYAEIPYDILYDEEVLNHALLKYDWLHLHHEDFTGQHGRFLRRESDRIQAQLQQATAQRLGYNKVSEMKLDVAKKIKAFCAAGGYLFAMCSGAETLDIALAAEGVNLDELQYEGEEPGEIPSVKLDFSKTLAFENFTLEPSYSRRFSDINTGWRSSFEQRNNFFTLFEFSAKWDVIPTLLTQNHEKIIKAFSGQTTAFNKYVIKSSVLILGENAHQNEVRYICSPFGKGHWTFYSGHDPESSFLRGREPTELNLHPHSPGYRLILNNVLFPSARKKKQKT